MFGLPLPGRFASRSFFFLFLLRVLLINTHRSMRTCIRYTYLLFLSQDFCVPVERERCMLRRPNRDSGSKKNLRFLSFRQRGTTFFGLLLRCRPFLCLLAILFSLITACRVSCRQYRAIGGGTTLLASRVIQEEGMDVVQCQRDWPRCTLGTQSREVICQICKSNKLLPDVTTNATNLLHGPQPTALVVTFPFQDHHSCLHIPSEPPFYHS